MRDETRAYDPPDMRPASAATPADLVQPDRIHRDLFLSPELFRLECERLFARAWIFAGHMSQYKRAGDFIALTVAGQPMILVRQPDGSIRALANRCAHKGAPLVSVPQGNVARMLRCPYHGWTYRTDGSPLAVPLKEGYQDTGLQACASGRGLAAAATVDTYRDFIFVRRDPEGMSLEGWFGEALQALDNMTERSPAGRLELVGPPVRHRIRCNWKIYLENINDALHPVAAHQSAAAAARRLWREQPEGTPMPMAVEQMLPFGSDYGFFDGMGARILPNGHSFFGTQFNIHTAYGALGDYEDALRTAWGRERAERILGFKSQNTVLYPSLSVKSTPLAIRVLRPLSVGETLLESWAFRAEGAPETMLERALTYNRLAFSPMSVVAHDDVHIFEAIQRNLVADGNPWISLHRDARITDEAARAALDGEGRCTRNVNSGNEALMRNQYRAWAGLMHEGAA